MESFTEKSYPSVEKDIVLGGLSFHVTVTGEGEPLVLIMGLGAPGDKWRPNVEVYSKKYQCITIDNRGAGRSSKPQEESYSTAQMAQDVLGIMDALNISSAHVNGVSMGGAIAQHLAADHPDRVRSLILTSTFASVSNSFRRAIETLRDTIDQLDPMTFKRLNQWMTFSQTVQNTRESFLLETAKQDMEYPYPMPHYAYKAQCNACLSHNTADRLKEIAAPTLIAAGDSDLFMTMEKTMELYEGIPGSELYLCRGGGHVHQWEQLGEYNRVTMEFLGKFTSYKTPESPPSATS